MMIQDLVASTTLEKIRASYKGSEFAYWPGEMLNPGLLMNWNTLGDIISFREFPHGEIMMAKDGGAFNPIRPRDSFRRPLPGVTEEVGSPDFISKLAHEGYTLALNAAQRHHSAISSLCFSLSGILSTKVTANCYASWRAISPFDIHWDGHDVLVLQMEGAKEWFIYGKSENLVETVAKVDRSQCPTDAIWHGVLRRGDMLYVPRGWWHKAVTSDEPSLHLTIGIKRLTILDFSNVVIGRMRSDPAVAENAPLFETEEEFVEFKNRFVRDFADAVHQTPLGDLRLEMRRSFEFRKMISIPFVGEFSRVKETDMICVQPFIECRHKADKTIFSDGNKKWSAPIVIGQVLAAHATGRPCSVGMLTKSAVEKGMSIEHVHRVMRDMVESGIAYLRTGDRTIPQMG